MAPEIVRRSLGCIAFASVACGPPAPGQTAAAPERAIESAVEPREEAPNARACGLAPGTTERVSVVDGVQRRWIARVGDAITAEPTVVFSWHGFGSDPKMATAMLEADTHWQEAIVVAPQGLPRTFEQFGDKARPGFQVHLGELDDRDLRLFDTIVAELQAERCIDHRRVYTTGFSNGGFMSNLLACHRGDVIAAAAPVGGGGPFVQPCKGEVPIQITHGRADDVVPFASAEASFATWVGVHGCSPSTVPPKDGCVRVPGCPERAPIEVCTFDGGHVWPRHQGARVAEFLRRHAKP